MSKLSRVSASQSSACVYVVRASGPQRCITGSSGLVSGWIWTLPSQRAAEDLDGSNCAGLERPLGDEGAQPAPIDDAMRVGTIVIIDGL